MGERKEGRKRYIKKDKQVNIKTTYKDRENVWLRGSTKMWRKRRG